MSNMKMRGLDIRGKSVIFREDDEMKKNILALIFGYLGSILGLLGLWLFNRYVLMTLALNTRMVAAIVTYWVIAFVPLVIMIFSEDKLTDYGFRKEKIHYQILTGILLGLLMSVVFTLLPHLLGYGRYVNAGKNYLHLWQFVYEFIYCILAIGLVEEFVFRGFLYHKAESILGNEIITIIVTSVLFGLFHFIYGNILQLFATSIIGVIFCVFKNKIKYCTTLSLIITHGIYDALITIWNYLLL